MSAIWVLLLLLVVGYIGSHVQPSTPGASRHVGSASGVELFALGALLGPHALAVLGGHELDGFRPLAFAALGWIAVGHGVECGLVGERRPPRARLALGMLATTTILVGTAASVYAVTLLFHFALDPSAAAFSLSCGLVAAETSRNFVRRVCESYDRRGRAAALVLDLSAADEVPVFLILAWLVSGTLKPSGALSHAPPALLPCATVAAGLLLGAMASWLIGRMSSTSERWTILLGAALLATGSMSRLGLSEMAAAFALGVMLRVARPVALTLRRELRQTEGAVLLPALLLSGASLSYGLTRSEWLLVAATLASRVLCSLVVGCVIAWGQAHPRPPALPLSLSLLSSGTLSIVVAFSLHLRFGGNLGRVVLMISFASAVLSELVGRWALIRLLRSEGEAPPSLPATHDVASAAR
jgi:Kef-type K+ transport system membrane component KefB